MVTDELKYQIMLQFGCWPTEEQVHALEIFARFYTDEDDKSVLILRGNAGTGKTTLSSAIVKALKKMHLKTLLLAPTGRAAKVLSINSGSPAYTVHRRIYREKSIVGVNGRFNLNDNLYTDTLFMVDEASMIANAGMNGGNFGSGYLLDDLVRFVYQGRNDRLMFVGDKAQLPPVGEVESPALNHMVLEGYGLKVYECDLCEVLRQNGRSGILYNATVIRNMIVNDTELKLPKITFGGFSDIESVTGQELVEYLGNSYWKQGMDETVVITRSNKRANLYNQGIRNMVLERDEELCSGDMLMIVKNNYYWTELERKQQLKMNNGKLDENTLPFLANGDRAKVKRVSHRIELYGFHFATLLLQFPDYGNYELEATVLLDTLTSEAPALTHEQQEMLFGKIEEDYIDIARKGDRMKAILNDKYYNALQVKFAYAVTCHKAQGGQWEHVYIDQGYMADDQLSPSYIHWLYTAFTRATEKLFLINWPKTQTLAK